MGYLVCAERWEYGVLTDHVVLGLELDDSLLELFLYTTQYF